MLFQHLAEYIKNQGLVTWQIRKGDKESSVVIFDSDEDLTMQPNIDKMLRTMKYITGAQFFLRGAKVAGKNAVTKNQIEFSKLQETDDNGQPLENQPAPQIQGATTPALSMVGYISEEEAQKRELLKEREMQLKYERDYFDKKIKDFDAEYREWQKERNSATNLILSKIGEIAKPFLEGMGQRTGMKMVAGTAADENNLRIVPKEQIIENQQNNSEMENDKILEQMEQDISEWLSLDADCPTLIAKIVELAKNNVGMYGMAKSMLMQQ
ncbi:MAG: hypothetical protein LBN95_13695 [Prevotellaceae bacterium]|jgi:hypothetical protein|nr:hypothetical protein [Prevotellaceae bacterium]